MNELGCPKVSILIPAYNREGLIEETVKSALNQNYPDFEIVIVDNCSTDNTYKLLEKLARKNERIKLFQNEKNLGPVKNWQKCLKYAKGEYVKILWSDDLMAEDFLEKTLPYIEQNEIAFAYSPAYIIYEHEKKLAYNLFAQDEIYPSEKFIEFSILGGNVPVSPGCAIFRKKDARASLIIEIPNNDSLDFNKYGAGNDMLLFLLVAAKYPKVAFISSTSSYFRAHKDSFTCSNRLGLYYDWARYYYLKRTKSKKLLQAFKTKICLRTLKNRGEYSNLNHSIETFPSLPYLAKYIIQKAFSGILLRT